MLGVPNLTTERADELVAHKLFPKVTKDSIEQRIADLQYVVEPPLTICIITMTNGFKMVGISASAHPGNYDADIGRRYAYDDAFKKLWPLEGYLLAEKLMVSKQLQDAGAMSSDPAGTKPA